MQRILQASHDYLFAQRRGQPRVSQGGAPVELGWKPPEIGWCKGNWDAAVEKDVGRMGLAVVIRDPGGNLLAARCEMRMGCLAPAAAEAHAVLLAIRLCRELGFEWVQLEGDAKLVIDAVSSMAKDFSRMGHVTEDIKQELNSLVH
ncbi:uncharacterized protein LOC132168511 [Corylus avellana]|uniref:uncharacterized protein LOC132168511 n=1 Tax=Corylus avellana TaxID=13451 RepID=UPI00286B1FC7|nr:uncharacterized protein LOC132168511 [Corylus avellana]